MAGEGGGHRNRQWHRRRSLSPHHWFVVAVIAALSVGGLVRSEDAAFAAFSLFYILFLHKYPFPPNSPSIEPPLLSSNGAFRAYISAAAVLGLVLPTAYVFEATYRDGDGGKAAAPHLFLLSCQVFFEGVTFAWPFSLPVRAFVPVFYNSRRLFAIADWLRHEVLRDATAAVPTWRSNVGKGLAVANMALWSFNLFGFLLPVYLPKVFQRYYGGKESRPVE